MDENDLRRLARKTGFNVATLEKDYALTWLLSGSARLLRCLAAYERKRV